MGGGGGGGGGETTGSSFWGILGELLEPPQAHHSGATQLIRAVGAVGSMLLAAGPADAERARAREREERRAAAEQLAARGNPEQPATSLLGWAGGALALGAGAAAVVALLGGGGGGGGGGGAEAAPEPPLPLAPLAPPAAAAPQDELLAAARGALAQALGRPLNAAELALSREQVVAALHRALGD